MTTHRIVFGDCREMGSVPDQSIQLIITSPPYWQLKDYGLAEQIGFPDSYEEYIDNLNKVWRECWRVLEMGCRLCINIGDFCSSKKKHGRYRIRPIHAETIKYCCSIGFDYLGAIIWQKITNCRPSGGARVMGSYPFPRNGIIKQDHEYILIFRKRGRSPPVKKSVKEESRLTKAEWKRYFTGHWQLPGVRQVGHCAQYPTELPRRLIKMFSFKGDIILDPFLGSGTTTQAAIETGRNSIGWELNPVYQEIINKKIKQGSRCKKEVKVSFEKHPHQKANR